MADRDALFDEATVKRIVEDMGGAKAILNDLKEFRRLVGRMESERSALMERHPDRWVAVGADGLVAVGDSMRETLDEVERIGLRRKDVVVEHLDTDPPVIILSQAG